MRRTLNRLAMLMHPWTLTKGFVVGISLSLASCGRLGPARLTDQGRRHKGEVDRSGMMSDVDAQKSRGQLRVATCQFPVGASIKENGEWIRRQMVEAKQLNAHLVHFSECALSGYAGKEFDNFDAFDWEALNGETEAILALAKSLELWVILGSSHRLSNGNKPHNSLYVIDPVGGIVDRYDKRFCTGGDLKHYSPGDHFAVFEINGVRCGCLICYDIRFPELYRQYKKLGVQLMFHSFHNARMGKDAIHPKIMPPSAQARAATNYMFISMNNSCVPHSWPSIFVTPDGLIEQSLEPSVPGIMVHRVDTNRAYYDASAPYRLECIDGKWHSGGIVSDPRSLDRTRY